MRIVAIADLHYDEQTRPRVEAIAGAVCGAEADVLVLAGDCAADGPERFSEVLGLLADFPGPRLMVPGNHDLWQHDSRLDTRRLYDEVIPAMAAAHGFHCLDREPFVLGDTAFVGCMGWYDYSFHQREAPLPGMTVTPVGVERGEGGRMAFHAVPGAREGAWEELRPEDYSAHGLIWQTDGPPHVAVWNDTVHVDWGRSDPAMAEHFAGRLREHLAAASGEARRIVGVTHFVPFAELADYHHDDPTRAFARAYLGSPLLGEALLEGAGVELVIYGHRHRQEVREVRGLVAADAGVADQDAGPLLLTLPD